MGGCPANLEVALVKHNGSCASGSAISRKAVIIRPEANVCARVVVGDVDVIGGDALVRPVPRRCLEFACFYGEQDCKVWDDTPLTPCCGEGVDYTSHSRGVRAYIEGKHLDVEVVSLVVAENKTCEIVEGLCVREKKECEQRGIWTTEKSSTAV